MALRANLARPKGSLDEAALVTAASANEDGQVPRRGRPRPLYLVFVGGREVDAKLLGLRNEKNDSFDMSSVTDEDDMNAALETLSASEPGWDGA